MQALIGAGADVDVNMKDEDGMTASHDAAGMGRWRRCRR